MKDIKASKNKIKYYLVLNIIKLIIFLMIPMFIFVLLFDLMEDDLLMVLFILSSSILLINMIFSFLSFYEMHQESLIEVSVFKKELVFRNKKINSKYSIPYKKIISLCAYKKNGIIKKIKIKELKNETYLRLFDDQTLELIYTTIESEMEYEKHQA